MKRILGGLLLACCLSLSCAPAYAQDTQNFDITSFVADYYVTRDADSVSQMEVHETIIAQFPDYDQNHGILRAIPENYDGHSLELKIKSVQKEDGSDWNYESYSENDNLVLKIGDADSYVYGRQVYNIAYTLRGVANLPTSSRIFWDANGDQWQQPFGEVVARVHLPTDLATSVNDEVACFTGVFGSAESSCAISKNEESNGEVMTFDTTRQLQAGETLTFEIPFADGTFAPYKMSSQLVRKIIFWSIAGTIPTILALVVMIVLWRRHGRDPKGKGVTVPQYLPPKGISVLGSSMILKQGFAPASVSATIIDLAVRHYIKVYETGKKTFDGYKYDLELTKKPSDLQSEEKAVIDALFGVSAGVGKRISLDDLKVTEALYKDAQEIGHDVEAKMTEAGYFAIKPRRARLPYFIVGGAIVAFGFIFPPYTLGLLPAGLIVLVFGFFMSAPTPKGAELKEYLLGIKMYMKLAEAERLKVLQSPRGDLTEKIDVANKGKLVKLYEKLLPYAMLFGIEKDWVKQFADLYERPPEWYSGTETFGAIYFASALHNMNTVTAASFSPPTSGITGAGGGGGGGGGGGW